MGLAEKIRATASAKEAGCREKLGFAAEAFKDELAVVLSKKGTKNNPSSPGEAPHMVTGRLVDSLVVEAYPGQGVAFVGPTVFYASILEPLRPFYDIAEERCRQKMRDIMFED